MGAHASRGRGKAVRQTSYFIPGTNMHAHGLRISEKTCSGERFVDMLATHPEIAISRSINTFLVSEQSHQSTPRLLSFHIAAGGGVW